MGAANDALRALGKCAASRIKVIGGPEPGDRILAPSVANLAANMEAGPGEDRSWRRWCRCGLGRESRSGKSGRCGECAGPGHGSFSRHHESSI
jgi:hypothetical protein